MPAPFTIVTFTDEDDYEFLICLAGHPSEEWAAETAFADLERLEDNGAMHPRGVIKLGSVKHV